MDFKNPVVVYTAPTNLEAHVVVTMLFANDVPAHAVEDQSGASIWAFGTISQFHKPNVFVDQCNYDRAITLIAQYEEQQRARANAQANEEPIEARCEECGKSSMFPKSQSGSVQECPHCYAYMDVGEIEWDVDFEENDEE